MKAIIFLLIALCLTILSLPAQALQSIFEIPTATITVDGSINDWSRISSIVSFMSFLKRKDLKMACSCHVDATMWHIL